MIKAVIFDMDGVISDSETTNFKAMLKTLSPFSITFDFKYYSRFPGGSCIEAYETIKRDFDANFDVNELVNAFNEMRVEIAKTDGWKPVENAIDTVKYCKEKYSLALASGSNPHIIKDIMQAFEIEQYFDSFISGETIEKCKPDPMIFEKSAAALSVLPNECVVIEDNGYQEITVKFEDGTTVDTTREIFRERRVQNPSVICNKSSNRSVRTVKGDGSFAMLYPDLLEDWDYENNTLTKDLINSS